jgi:hypothetical protein
MLRHYLKMHPMYIKLQDIWNTVSVQLKTNFQSIET